LFQNILTEKEGAIMINFWKACEERIMKALDHPSIINLFEMIVTEKTLWVVMKYTSI
jgi:hypothetical protein